jgi:hypothetical protein
MVRLAARPSESANNLSVTMVECYLYAVDSRFRGKREQKLVGKLVDSHVKEGVARSIYLFFKSSCRAPEMAREIAGGLIASGSDTKAVEARRSMIVKSLHIGTYNSHNSPQVQQPCRKLEALVGSGSQLPILRFTGLTRKGTCSDIVRINLPTAQEHLAYTGQVRCRSQEMDRDYLLCGYPQFAYWMAGLKLHVLEHDAISIGRTGI